MPWHPARVPLGRALSQRRAINQRKWAPHYQGARQLYGAAHSALVARMRH